MVARISLVPHSKPWLTPSDADAVKSATESGHIGDRYYSAALEQRLARDIGIDNVHFVNSGTSALHIAIASLSLAKDDEVLFPTYVCENVAQAVMSAGARPVLCDIGPNWTMTPESIARSFSQKTRAIVLVGVFGISESASKFRDFGVPIVNDVAQCFDDLLVGNGRDEDVGDIVACSLGAIKCFTSGTGGFVAARSPWETRVEAVLKCKRSEYMGSDIGAALGLSQLERYPDFQRRRVALADSYFEHLPPDLTSKLRGLKHSSHYRFPLSQSSASFDVFAERMFECNVIVRRGVDRLLHRKLGLSDADFPNAVRCFDETVSIPIYPALGEDDVGIVIEACGNVWDKLVRK